MHPDSLAPLSGPPLSPPPSSARYSINNLGDPFDESNYGVHSRTFEIEVLDFFARLWQIERKDYWGYITTCGTEGNMLGILYGREAFPDGVLLASRASHYSVMKAARMYRMGHQYVDAQLSGEMDYDDFAKQLAALDGKPAIVCINAGTTVKGAVDSVATVLAALSDAGYTPGKNAYIHCDGALAGLLLPFIEGGHAGATFADGIDSMSVSGHKMLGTPMPCGVVITRRVHMERYSREVEYLNSTDTTIMGSRNGQAALAMWLALQRQNGTEGLLRDCRRCVENAKYLLGKLQEAGVSAMLNPLSTTVVFERPNEVCARKWQLACQGSVAHVVVMPSVTPAKLDEFFADYIKGRIEPVCVQEDMHECFCAPCATSTSVTCAPSP